MRLRTQPLTDRQFDLLVAAAWLIALEIENASLHHHRGPLTLNVLVIAAMTGPALWRRRFPLGYSVIVLAGATALVAGLSADGTNLAPIYVLTVPPYTLAAYKPRRAALAGLVIFLGWATIDNAASSPSPGNYAGAAITVGLAWTLGRWTRARRQLSIELERTADRLEAERESRALLAVADERTRIARELHTLVAGSISAMVVQTEAAQLLLDNDIQRAEQAMAAAEQTGRDALAQMRRILGVLRHPDQPRDLAPQPGVGQIHALIEHARSQRRRIELSVEGEPGPLPASVDLGLYRILEDALTSEADDPAHLIDVRLRFDEHEISLEIAVSGPAGAPPWPTLAMHERAALCGGAFDSQPGTATGRRLVARLPRSFEEAFA
jgi:signal transduction histidine kinase